jgi:ketosteroid isomerase-like protein
MTSSKYSAFMPVKPYFDLVRGTLGDLVDGEHFFDCVDDGIVYEVLYEFPGWPRITEGKADLMESFRGYGKYIVIHAADHLTRHLADDGHVVIIEYEVHGTILSTGVHYNNRFCSIITIADRQIVHWRDYMDSLAAWNALSSKAGKS